MNPDIQRVIADLRRPFTPAALKFKIQAGGGIESDKKPAICIAFIDARLVIERLNAVVGLDWHDEYEPFPAGLVCRLTVMGTTRTDVGEPGDSPQGKKPKALYSDALKRAGVKFGIGVPVYAMPIQRLQPEHLTYAYKPDPKDRKANGIKPSGIALLREGYAKWLEMEGIKAFGGMIDHGDAIDAAGDTEVEPAIDPETGEVTRPAMPAAQTTSLSAAPPPAPERKSPKDMAVLAFVEWMQALGQGKEGKETRNLVCDALRTLTGAALPSTWSGRGELAYGLLGEVIQDEAETLAVLGQRVAAHMEAQS